MKGTGKVNYENEQVLMCILLELKENGRLFIIRIAIH